MLIFLLSLILGINSLNSKDWEKTKRRVQTKVREMAEKLLKIYAERKSKKGFSFSKDCDLSLEFEKDIPEFHFS